MLRPIALLCTAFVTPRLTTVLSCCCAISLSVLSFSAQSQTSEPSAAEPNGAEVEQARPILEELRVTASRLATPPASIDVRRLGAQAPAFRSQNDLGAALQGHQGITFTNTGGPGKVSALRIRGEEASRTTVLIDGIELSDVSAPQVITNVHHLALTPDIAGVDVLAGPQAFFLGADAGGVLNIRTSAPPEGYLFESTLEGGSDNHMKLSALAGGSGSRGGAVVSAQKWRTSGFNARLDDTTRRDDDGYDNVTLHARGHWKPTDNSVLELVVRDVDATTDFDSCGFPRTDNCVEEFEQTSIRLGGALEGRTLSHRFAISHSEVDRENFADGNFSFGAEGDLTKYEYSLQGTGDVVQYSGGIELRQEESGARERDQWGVFGELGAEFDQGLSAGIGLRLDDNDDFGSHLTGRAHGAWETKLSDNRALRLRASYGTGFRAPSLSEEDYNAGPFAFPPASTTNLREERSRGIDLGVQLSAARYSGAVTLFSQKIEDEIFFDLTSFAGFLQANGTTKSQGITLRGSFQVTPQLVLSGDYMYNRARTATSEDRLRRPRNSGRLTAEYQHESLSVGANLRYVGTVDDEIFGVGRQELDDYVLVDLVGSWQVRPALEVFGRVTNLFDENYQDVAGFRSAGVGVYAGVKMRLTRNQGN